MWLIMSWKISRKNQKEWRLRPGLDGWKVFFLLTHSNFALLSEPQLFIFAKGVCSFSRSFRFTIAVHIVELLRIYFFERVCEVIDKIGLGLSASMRQVTLIDSKLLRLIINRLCYQLIENHDEFKESVIIGLQPRGVFLAENIVERLRQIQPKSIIQFGVIDPTFYRDDFRRSDKSLIALPTDIPMSLEGKNIVFIDDVLYTGRTIRAGLEGMLEYGRPASVELLVLIDRRFTRELPIEPKYIGKSVDSYDNQKVKVMWKKDGGEDKVLLLTEN
jgi:pyrimidine operon attenuation protein/uracil phosphoribosyltransferase